jgi:hypothetical protein
MKKKSHLYAIFVLVLMSTFCFTFNANATNDADPPSLQQVLGVQPDSDYAKVDLATTPKGIIIMATVEDPSKIGGCKKGDRVELINLGNGKWKITRLATERRFKFTVQQEDGVMKINKTKKFGLMLPESSFNIGFDTRYIDYEEEGLMEEEGWMYGIVGSYIYHGNNKLMFETSLSYVFGEIDYDGQTESGTPLKADTNDWIFEWRGLIGKDYRLRDSGIATPFIGVGYRYWNDDIDASGGYEREIQYWYVPIGVKTIGTLIGNWTWGVSIEYDLFLSGEVKSHISDIHPAFNDPENDQDFEDGYGVGLALQFNRKLSDNYGFSIEPYIRYWDIDESDISTLTEYGIPIAYLVEPENETTVYGLRLIITF